MSSIISSTYELKIYIKKLCDGDDGRVCFIYTYQPISVEDGMSYLTDDENLKKLMRLLDDERNRSRGIPKGTPVHPAGRYVSLVTIEKLNKFLNGACDKFLTEISLVVSQAFQPPKD